MTLKTNHNNPMKNVDDWEENLLERYPDPSKVKKEKKAFRNYVDSERLETVKEFYRLNHEYQTYDFVCFKEAEFLKFNRKEMSIWESLDFLNTLIDDSDPDIDLDQLQHLLQTSEAIRADGHPDWFVLTGFIHDVGKILCLFGEEQWAVVGDTFPVGCAFSDKIVYPEFFKQNPDYNDARYNTKLGVYTENCGLDNVKMSWGHDEYLYQILKDYLPEPALYIIRYHSFYSQHRDEDYLHLMNEKDIEMFEWVKKFNPYDLYSKAPVPPNAEALLPYYKELVDKYLPGKLKF